MKEIAAGANRRLEFQKKQLAFHPLDAAVTFPRAFRSLTATDLAKLGRNVKKRHLIVMEFVAYGVQKFKADFVSRVSRVGLSGKQKKQHARADLHPIYIVVRNAGNPNCRLRRILTTSGFAKTNQTLATIWASTAPPRR